MEIPRGEHPNPQLERKDWMNLNGIWEFAKDPGRSGRDRRLYEGGEFDREILVPFCMESRLSGIGERDFVSAVWYRRRVTLPKGWESGRVFLRFGAVDYQAYVYVNGKLAGEHRGGYASFSFDVTELIRSGENEICVCAEDDVRSPLQPRGKQCEAYASRLCDYTRTTGIWQTVWLEHVPEDYIAGVRFEADPKNSRVDIRVEVKGAGRVSARVSYCGIEMGKSSAEASGGQVHLNVALREAHLWEPGHGRLYDVELSFGKDRVRSYFGLRSIELEGEKFLINGKPVFQRLVLDQGFYPDGIYTAADEEELIRDIKLAQACGFNGARLHQKVFEARYLYHCDRLGYLVWGEYGSWGVDLGRDEAVHRILAEWLEIVERDYSHPSIVAWCPLNESHPEVEGRRLHDETVRLIYRATKAADRSRPCIDVSGYCHVETDIYDLHDYDQEPERLREHYAAFAGGGEPYDWKGELQRWKGEPVMISEYGGINWHPGDEEHWEGYGEAPESAEAFLELYKGITEAIMENPRIFGFCYTQLYDVEQEKNGLYTYEREAKFDTESLRRINERRAAYEEEEALEMQCV